MKIWLKVLLALLVIGLIGAALVYVFVYNKPHQNIAKAKPDYILSASDLYSAFINDPVGSAQLYNGKVIQLDGNPNAIETAGELTILVFIFNDGLFGPEGIRCTVLPEMLVDAKNVKPGDYLKIKGLCTGFNDQDVILEKCSIVK